MFSIVEILVAVYEGAKATYKPAFAIAYEGKVVISSHSEAPDWSYDRAEMEAHLEEMLKE